MVTMAPEDEVKRLVDELKDTNSGIPCFRSANSLVKMGKSAVPYLIELLKDDSVTVRVNGAIMLGEIRDDTAVPALISALRDKHSHVRYYSALALGKLNDKSAAPYLIEALKDENPLVCSGSIMALKMIIGGHNSIEDLSEIRLAIRYIHCLHFQEIRQKVALLLSLLSQKINNILETEIPINIKPKSWNKLHANIAIFRLRAY